MARYYGLETDIPDQKSERLVAAALRKLPDDWTVFHHVTWQSVRGGRQGDGEADFILLHPKAGAIVVEVKGGGIDITNGRWRSTDRYGQVHEIKNPFEQALASKHALLSWLGDLGLNGRLSVGHAVALPNVDSAPLLGPIGTPQVTWTRRDLDGIHDAIRRTLTHWSLKASLSDEDIKKLTNLLAPTISIRRKLASASAEAETQLLKLTAEQVEAFAGLRAARGGLILGGAGTGKTILAIARSQLLSQNGFQTLLVCYNELLGQSLDAQFVGQSSPSVGTFHSICFRQAARAKLPIPQSPPPTWWENDAPNLLIEACANNNTQFDAIVVDEGQDFSPAWLDALRCLTSTRLDAPFYVFADPRQDLWSRDWSRNSDWQFVYELKQNLRNTQPIAERVAAAIGIDPFSRGVAGPAPLWRSVDNPKRTEHHVIAMVERLIDEGFGPQNLTVLCSSHNLVAKLREQTIGPFSFGKWGSKGIPVETIARFKGLESEAVILAIEDERSGQDQALAYVGLSRARSLLAVVGSPQQRSLLNWPQELATKSK